MKHLFAILAALPVLAACSSLPDIPKPDLRAVPLIGADVAPLAVSDSFVAAEARLREAIAVRGLSLFTVIDHGGNALAVGRDIGQSKLFVFGDPRGGTSLMETNPEIGLALPLKVLIYTDRGGRTKVITTDIRAVGEAYGFDKKDARLDRVTDVLNQITKETAE